MNVGFASYLFAFIAYAALTGLLVTSWRGRTLGRLLILASGFSAIWAIFSALASLAMITWPAFLQFLEFSRDGFWCLFLLKSVQTNNVQVLFRDLKLTPNRMFIIFLVLAGIITVVSPVVSVLTDSKNWVSRDITLGTWVLFNIIALLLLEQLFRNSTHDQRWAIKHLCIGIGCIFAFDFFMFADALLFKQLNPALWNARGIVNGLMVPLIAISIARNPKWSLDIYVSRNVVFQSVTLIGAGIYLLVMASAGYYIRFYGGSWGSTLQIGFLSGTGALLLIILFSGTIRAKIRVFLSKHFFNYKYDYREEWLRFTQTLSDSDDPVPVRAIRAISALVSSTGGALWIRDERNLQFHFNACLNMPEPSTVITPENDSLVHFIGTNQWLVDLDEYQRNPDLYDDFSPPSWLQSIDNAWLVVPLLFKSEVLGFIVILRSNSQKTINWEDRDLLKMAGQQAASHMAQHVSETALTHARQFEAFNRLSAYVVHDLKNILAQQTLIVSNAEKHKHKPEFVDDVITTVRNSVDRMTRLMEQMKSGMRGHKNLRINLLKPLNEAHKSHLSRLPSPTMMPFDGALYVHADSEQLSTVFGHIIQNAQDATPGDGHVTISLAQSSGNAVIKIDDSGCGMDAAFIKHRLFHPFDSTKGLTGMGIGVFESREYIRSLGGDIKVTSTPGEGSTFIITVPCTTSIE